MQYWLCDWTDTILASNIAKILLFLQDCFRSFTGGCYVSFLTYVVNTSSIEKRGHNLTILATVATVCAAFGYFIGGMLGGTFN